MKKLHNRTKIEEFFSVPNIITSYHYEPIPPTKDQNFEVYGFWQIVYVTRGQARIYVENNEIVLNEGEIIFHAPSEPHYMPASGNDSFDAAIVSFECDSPNMEYFRGKTVTLFGEEAGTLLDLIKTGARLFEPIKDDNSYCGLKLKNNIHPVALQFVGVSLERFLLMIFGRLNNIDFLLNEQTKVNKHNQESQIIKDIKYFMMENTSINLSIDDIGHNFGINTTTLRKLFKRETGDSLINYFLTLKINEAKRLIKETSLNFTQISEELGFSSLNYFSKLFKKRTGRTLSEYSLKQPKRHASSSHEVP